MDSCWSQSVPPFYQVINRFLDRYLSRAISLSLSLLHPSYLSVSQFPHKRSSEGDLFDLHADGYYSETSNRRSIYSLLIYLNRNYHGGKTAFITRSATLSMLPSFLYFSLHLSSIISSYCTPSRHFILIIYNSF